MKSANGHDEPVLRVNSLNVRYGKRAVLNGLSMQVSAGEVFGLLGPNGAGKTTLIRSICGRIRPKSGSISIAGMPIKERKATRQIGLVPQEIALYQHLTARENLVTFARLAGLSAAKLKSAVEFAVDAARLRDHLNDQVGTLSGGWKRRVNIAAAILHHPALLILDEPTVGVDIDARNALHEVIKDLRNSGMAVLLSTHDMDQAEVLCGSIGFLRGGVLAPTGNPQRLLHSAFGDHQEILIRLHEPAPPKISAIFEHLGFSGQAISLERRRLLVATPEEQARLSKALQDQRLGVREIRFRKPGLEALFLKLKQADTVSQ